MKKVILISISAVVVTCLLLCNTSIASGRYYGTYLCGYSGFKCLKVGKHDTWEKLFPNQREREIVKRLNRMNMPVKYRSWIVVPTNLGGINYMSLSPFPAYRSTGGKKLVYVDIGKQAFGAYDADGRLVHWGPVSGGKGYCPDTGQTCNTSTGHFKVYRKQGPECISTKFPLETNGGAPMPYCIHYNGGYALHGSTLPGYNASHGCVRLFFEDAKWLNHEFTNIGTPVVVTRT